MGLPSLHFDFIHTNFYHRLSSCVHWSRSLLAVTVSHHAKQRSKQKEESPHASCRWGLRRFCRKLCLPPIRYDQDPNVRQYSRFHEFKPDRKLTNAIVFACFFCRQLRRQETSVEKVVVKIKHSLQEPALRLQHSLQEPLLRSSVDVGGIHEPGLHLKNPTTKVTKTFLNKGVNSNIASRPPVTASLGPFGTASRIVQREGFFALYKGLTAVYTGIVPKMAIRFVSFEQYREFLSKFETDGKKTSRVTFFAGLASGLTEAVLIVTPAEVCKIRLQSQYHSLMDPSQMQHRKYKNVIQAAFVITKEEGISALYKGIVPTMLRQGINQAVNFTV